jgi:hypothetical protein
VLAGADQENANSPLWWRGVFFDMLIGWVVFLGFMTLFSGNDQPHQQQQVCVQQTYTPPRWGQSKKG